MSLAHGAGVSLTVVGGAGYVYYWIAAWGVASKLESRPGQVSMLSPTWMAEEDALPAEHEHLRRKSLGCCLLMILGNLLLFLV